MSRFRIVLAHLQSLLFFLGLGLASVAGAQGPDREQVLLADERNTMEIVDDVSRSVVAVQISGVEGRRGSSGGNRPGGSGFVVDEEGRIITNFHVVASALADIDDEDLQLAEGARITVVYVDDPEDRHPARILGANPDIDMALLELENPADAPRPVAIPLGDSDEVRGGQKAVVIGNPFGLNSSVTTGIVSAVERERPGLVGIEIPYIQTDAAVNPGNSGGPVLDSSGEVIGIANAVLSPLGTFTGVGLAVPVNLLRDNLEQMREGGLSGLAAKAMDLPEQPRLGMQIALAVESYPPPLRKELKMPDQGVVVTGVTEGGPADKAGIRGPRKVAVIGQRSFPVGMDVIVSIEGKSVARPIQLQREVLRHGEGDEVTLTVWRDGETREVEVPLEIVQAR